MPRLDEDGNMVESDWDDPEYWKIVVEEGEKDAMEWYANMPLSVLTNDRHLVYSLDRAWEE